jgi:SAM-dependent methyltransferase
MLEILAGRLLAPYVGVTLETYTAIIGTVLAGIAFGAWAGGRLADRVDPRRVLGPVIALGGALALFIVPVIRFLGDTSGSGHAAPTITLAVAGFFLPAVVLSAVTPMVVKLQLHDLHATGGVVGRLSGISTLGALVGTFVTGFVLVATIPTRTLIGAVGAMLMTVGVALGLFLSRRGVAPLVALVLLGGTGATFGAVAHEPCQVESAYFCMRVDHDLVRPTGRILWLDNVEHSYVDLADPTYLGFDYTQSIADAIDITYPGKDALDALHVGGGGFTMPRYLAATRPGSQSVVLELDPAVLKIGRDRLGLKTSSALQVRVGDARLGIRGRADDSADVVIGDAFSGLSVPWHLTTREFVAEIDRVLRPGGIYVANVIDYPTFKFARAELATLLHRFEHVAAIAPEGAFDGEYGSNIVLVASHRAIPERSLAARAADHGDAVLEDAALARFVGDAPEITDDYAPVDQWLDETRP